MIPEEVAVAASPIESTRIGIEAAKGGMVTIAET
jgi:hypothetical protein